MTRRTETHVIDTLAVRQIISVLPENWLVRGLEERDYGIDLSIELFDGEMPTGCFSLIQVKGKRKKFESEPVSLSGFPTKTLEYSTLFPEPFFIFHTSIEDKKTYFVWAQKYIDVRLIKDRPNWITQESNTIKFPIENILGSEEGNAKIEKIMRVITARKSGLDYLADYEWLKTNWESYKLGQTNVILTCIEILKRIRTHNAFFSVYDPEALGVDFYDLLNCLEALRDRPLKEDTDLSEDEARELARVDMHMNILDAVKMTFLSQRDMDELEEDISSTSPY
ncbi:DUF4365 domain-containing protein [Shewanella algae]|uniref:DUF4365 domain-containing protein n=1 Tax=Shewanella algae TaxID=38313 RepID=UPI001AAE8294|nr:DUF4365 domain-containing protein [Shewanella algae]MBO2630868.1 DUF4365 domain-containing protein [Shewanella algae]